MDKLSWSYIVSFFLVIMAAVLAISYTGEREELDHYLEVQVKEGDSLWKIADEYKEYDNMSHSEFVKWVQERNNLQSLVVKPETIVIPIEKINTTMLNIWQTKNNRKEHLT